MLIDCIADLHGAYPKLAGGDLLIVAGDLTAGDQPIQYGHFGAWMDRQKYRKKILIAGNHDNYFDRKGFEFIRDVYESIDVEYLCDSGTEFEGLKIWGSPWTRWFEGINPHCTAFTLKTDEELAEKWALIPDDIDILVTHSPMWGLGDKTKRGEHVGSRSLGLKMAKNKPPKLWICGHIHEAYGEQVARSGCRLVNASIMNEDYDPVNKPVRVIL